MNSVNRRKKGEETRAAILIAARELLLEEGHGKFVFRGVAKRAGIEPGNVQYYFASKSDLIRGVLVSELQDYTDRLATAVKKGRTNEEQINLMVDWLISDMTDKPTLRLWLSIWGMAAFDEELAEIVSTWYHDYIMTFSELLQEVFPQLNDDQAIETATTITAQFDGLMIVLLLGRPDQKTLEAIERNINSIITKIVDVTSGT